MRKCLPASFIVPSRIDLNSSAQSNRILIIIPVVAIVPITIQINLAVRDNKDEIKPIIHGQACQTVLVVVVHLRKSRKLSLRFLCKSRRCFLFSTLFGCSAAMRSGSPSPRAATVFVFGGSGVSEASVGGNCGGNGTSTLPGTSSSIGSDLEFELDSPSTVPKKL